MDPFQWPRHLPRNFASQNRAGDQRMQEVMRGWTCPLRWLLGVPNCIARLVPWHQVLSPCLAQKSDLAPATCFNLILWLLPDVSNAEAANIHAWIEFLAAVFGMYCISSVDLLWHVLECLFLYQQAKKLPTSGKFRPTQPTYSQLYRYDNHKDTMDSLENHHPVLSFITAFFHWLSLINQRVSRLQLTRILLSDQTLP